MPYLAPLRRRRHCVGTRPPQDVAPITQQASTPLTQCPSLLGSPLGPGRRADRAWPTRAAATGSTAPGADNRHPLRPPKGPLALKAVPGRQARQRTPSDGQALGTAPVIRRCAPAGRPPASQPSRRQHRGTDAGMRNAQSTASFGRPTRALPVLYARMPKPSDASAANPAIRAGKNVAPYVDHRPRGHPSAARSVTRGGRSGVRRSAGRSSRLKTRAPTARPRNPGDSGRPHAGGTEDREDLDG